MDRPKLNNDQIYEIINDLRGTCQSFESIVVYHTNLTPDEIDPAFLDVIDENIFLCETCGWWCDEDEESETEGSENICKECQESE